MTFPPLPLALLQSTLPGSNRGTTSYSYDARDRLTGITYPNGKTISYGYDAAGNRTSLTTANQGVSYTFDILNRLSTVTDENGNTLSKADGTTTTAYAYDSRNRLSNLNAGQVTYLYDATGIRMSETSAGLTTHYLVDPKRDYAQVLEESLDLNAFSEVRYTYGDDLIAQHRRIDATTTTSSTYHYDGIGSTRQLTNTSGAVTDSYAFEAFGGWEISVENGDG